MALIDYWVDALIIFLGFLLTMIITNYLVQLTIWYVDKSSPKSEKQDEEKEEETPAKKRKRSKIGFIVGRCENILILTFMLLNQVTALVVIIGIKGLVRREDIEKKPGYYLVGTIVNLTLSILLGLLIKAFLWRFGILLGPP
jgi:hypothetical protein